MADYDSSDAIHLLSDGDTISVLSLATATWYGYSIRGNCWTTGIKIPAIVSFASNLSRHRARVLITHSLTDDGYMILTSDQRIDALHLMMNATLLLQMYWYHYHHDVHYHQSAISWMLLVI